VDIASARKLVVSMGEWAIESAIGGLGLAIGRLPLVDDEIAAGRIVTASDSSMHDRLLADQIAGQRNSARGGRVPQLVAQGNGASQLARP
jgi:hypothetical protein